MSQSVAGRPSRTSSTVFPVLAAISFCHFLNDTMQSLLPALYPILKGNFALDFGQIGFLTLTYQITASLLQPLVGLVSDRKPRPYSLPVGMAFTLIGLVTLAYAPSYAILVCGAALLGIGSSIFHPESSRIARMASGGAHGLAQSLFQVGGNFGTAMGPLLAAYFVVPRGRESLAWFALVALGGIALLTILGRWYEQTRRAQTGTPSLAAIHAHLSRAQVGKALFILIALVFSKYFYLASITSYYTFYLMHHFGLPVRSAQTYLFVFLAAAAAGTIIGGPVGDKVGRKLVIWISILGVLPFTLMLPYAGLHATIGLSIIIGLILSSAFSAIVVYAQELMPGRVGTVAGLFFGFSFGMGGLGAAVLGELADHTSIEFVYHVCAYLPAIGLLTAFLPNLRDIKPKAADKTVPPSPSA
ncbi:MFS transporter [Acetobacter indonesiensis]|uniref:Fosmidomycin resistance protein n=1 Tax=Acetobacter indonesiensis TaxID=104101 RepID=A0A252AVB0_9PROT|nr:MFS transporter [Acetobacter indonesiensis]OUI94394.1 Fosmidomycin resistance protein [Acetobacter indonesiensis]